MRRGKWQRLILEALETVPFIAVRDAFPMLCRSDYSAVHRAVKSLTVAGEIQSGLFWDTDYRGVRKLVLCIGAKDLKTTDGEPFDISKRSVERVPSGTGSTFSGSLRHIASSTNGLLGSKSTVARRLADPEVIAHLSGRSSP